MKAYPLTEKEMLGLGAVQGFSAVFFTLAGILLGFWISTGQAIAFASSDIEESKLSYWEGVRDASCIGMIIFGLAGIGMFVLSGWAVISIKSETDHD